MDERKFLEDNGFEKLGLVKISYLDRERKSINKKFCIQNEESNFNTIGSYAFVLNGIVLYIGNKEPGKIKKQNKENLNEKKKEQYISDRIDGYMKPSDKIPDKMPNGKKGLPTFKRIAEAFENEFIKNENIEIEVYVKRNILKNELIKTSKNKPGGIYYQYFNRNPIWNTQYNNDQKNYVEKYIDIIIKNISKKDSTRKDQIIKNEKKNKNIENELNNGLEEDAETLKQACERNKRSYTERIKALEQSNNECCYSKEHKSFLRRTPIMNVADEKYLEVHHLIPLGIIDSDEKDDLVGKEITLKNLDVAENMICLCSNCHNKLHYGKEEECKEILKILYHKNEAELRKKNLDIGVDNIIKIYKNLYWSKPK